ncbi:magnesium/cobalt transporter CorA [Myxococcota bacterium]|nr:magnesium/cobalt transporter CorA [Myxococcota bacterium]
MSENTLRVERSDSRPGAFFLPADSPPPRVRFMEYDEAILEEGEVESPEELRCYAETERPTWIDVQGFGDEGCLREIGRVFDIHTLALADAVNVPQRAKTQRYPEHLLIVVHAPDDRFAESERTAQVAILLAREYVVSFQERPFGFFDDVRERLRNPASGLRRLGPSYLAYALVDALVDRYYPLLAEIAEELDLIEEHIFTKASPDLVARLHGLQRRTTQLLRVHRPQVDALHQLVRHDSALIPDAIRLYFNDVEDHARQILGSLEATRDSATDAMNAIHAILGHRQNEVMKLLTLVGSIFIPLTFIVGIYGMNFDYMPELRSRLGYPAVMGGMAVLALGMLAWFRSKGWLGGSRDD